MTNNDVLRRVRYILDFNDGKMKELFELGGLGVTRVQIGNWLKREDDPEYVNCPDKTLAIFLNGLIVDRRGKQDGKEPVVEKTLNPNIILRKLKIALNLKAEDMIEILASANMPVSKHELSAFFRKPDHKHYRACGDQILRRFLKGLQHRFR